MSVAVPERIAAGTPAYRRLLGAVFLAGFAVFLVMYDTQGLLPQISQDLNAGESAAGWTVAGTTLGMAAGMIPLSTVGLSRGLFSRMLVFLVLAAALGLVVAAMPGIGTLVAARIGQGVLISLVPASALALIGERVEHDAITGATGVYLAGNTIGGLFSRLGPGLVAQVADWRWAIATMSVVCLLCAVAVARLRPAGPDVVSGERRSPLPAVRVTLGAPRIVAACVIGAALMAAFNSAYTVVGYRLQGPAIGLGPAAANLVFVLYLSGTVTSARAGRIVARVGTVPAVLVSCAAVAAGYWIAAPTSLAAIVLGLGVMTAMFFVGHTVASSTVSRLAPAEARSTASAVYLTVYYLGATGGSALGALAFEHRGWTAVAALGTLYAVVAAVAVLFAAREARRPPATDADLRP